MRRDGFQPYFNLDDLPAQEEGRIVEETRAFMTASRAEYQAEQREAEPQLEKMPQQLQFYKEFLAAAPPRSGAQPAPTSERRNAYFLYGKAGRGKTFVLNAFAAAARARGLVVLTTATTGVAALDHKGYAGAY
eukprot:gene19226-30952_t